MAKHYKEYNRSLVDGGNWTDLVDSLKTGIYEVELPNYSALRSLQVIVSRFNANEKGKFKYKTSAKYEPTIILRIEVDKR